MITVYLDMDGVLADFNARTLELISKSLDDFDSSQAGWDALGEHKYNIYLDLPLMPNATILVEGILRLCTKYEVNYGVLTAVPKVGRVPKAKEHKKFWLSRHFPELLNNFNIGPHAEYKQYHANPGDVLIDDMKRNIEQWRSREGYGILYGNAENTLLILEEYLKAL